MHQNRNCRILLTVFLSIHSCSCLQAQIRLAALGGVHSANLIEKNDIPGYELSNGKYYTSKTGFELGVIAEVPFGKKNLFFQPGILYSAKGNQYERFYDSTLQSDTLYNQQTLNLNYVEIPLYLTWKVSLSKNQKSKFYISAGPYFSFIYGVSQSYQNRIIPYNSTNYLYRSGKKDKPVGNAQGAYKTYDIGMAAKAGFELGSVMIGAYFSQGLTNVYTASYPSSFHNQVFGGSLAIWLNNPKPEPKPLIDTDKDGTPDLEDSCKTIAGPPRWHGCPVPDTDHDGIDDEQDSCKMIPGVLRYHGCPVPDTDRDGIDDEQDSCKMIPGVLRYHGCPVPDSDGDDINDEEDSCKYVPGVPEYHGCPIPDSDHDGLNDEIDKCPNQPGPADNDGCPIVKAEMLKTAQLVAANLMFQSNSAKLTKNSYSALRELADSLKTNPELNLWIEGHTDNLGKRAFNKKLSENRAATVKKQLVRMGISVTRIETRGFGDSQPIAPNNSPEGRAENRRVVFKFHLKNS